MPATTDTPVTSKIPVADRPFGTQADASATIEKRILREKGPQVPVAAFQSSI